MFPSCMRRFVFPVGTYVGDSFGDVGQSAGDVAAHISNHLNRRLQAGLVDIDGNTFIDYVMSWGPLIHGHAPRGLVSALGRAVKRGTSYGAPSPLEVELGLEKVIPAEFMLHAHHWLILHGRYTCLARKPRCEVCLINDLCRWPEKTV